MFFCVTSCVASTNLSWADTYSTDVDSKITYVETYKFLNYSSHPIQYGAATYYPINGNSGRSAKNSGVRNLTFSNGPNNDVATKTNGWHGVLKADTGSATLAGAVMTGDVGYTAKSGDFTGNIHTYYHGIYFTLQFSDGEGYYVYPALATILVTSHEDETFQVNVSTGLHKYSPEKNVVACVTGTPMAPPTNNSSPASQTINNAITFSFYNAPHTC